MIATGNAATIVDDRHRVVGVNRDLDVVAVAGQGLVDRVVDDLVDEVVQTSRAGRADVHARTPADGLESLEDRDVLRVVSALLVWAPCGAIVNCQRSSDDIRDAPDPRNLARAGASRIVHIMIAQRGSETACALAPFCLQTPENGQYLSGREQVGFIAFVALRTGPSASALRGLQSNASIHNAQLLRASADAYAKGCRRDDVGDRR